MGVDSSGQIFQCQQIVEAGRDVIRASDVDESARVDWGVPVVGPDEGWNAGGEPAEVEQEKPLGGGGYEEELRVVLVVVREVDQVIDAASEVKIEYQGGLSATVLAEVYPVEELFVHHRNINVVHIESEPVDLVGLVAHALSDDDPLLLDIEVRIHFDFDDVSLGVGTGVADSFFRIGVRKHELRGPDQSIRRGPCKLYLPHELWRGGAILYSLRDIECAHLLLKAVHCNKYLFAFERGKLIVIVAGLRTKFCTRCTHSEAPEVNSSVPDVVKEYIPRNCEIVTSAEVVVIYRGVTRVKRVASVGQQCH